MAKTPLFQDLNLMIEVGERVAVIGPNGIGKITLLRTLVGDWTPDEGEVKWSENVRVGYFAQDHAEDFAENLSLFEWMAQWMRETDDDQAVARYSAVLFSRTRSGNRLKCFQAASRGVCFSAN